MPFGPKLKFEGTLEKLKPLETFGEDDKLEETERLEKGNDQAGGNGTLGHELENIPDHVEGSDGASLTSGTDTMTTIDADFVTRTADTEIFPALNTDNEVLRGMTTAMRAGNGEFNYRFKELTTGKDAKETLYKSLLNQRAEMHVMIEKYGTPPTIFKRVHFVKDFNDIRGGEVSGMHKELGEDLWKAIEAKVWCKTEQFLSLQTTDQFWQNPEAFANFYDTVGTRLRFDSELKAHPQSGRPQLKTEEELQQVDKYKRFQNRTKRFIIARNALRYAEKKALAAYGKQIEPAIKMAQGG